MENCPIFKFNFDDNTICNYVDNYTANLALELINNNTYHLEAHSNFSYQIFGMYEYGPIRHSKEPLHFVVKIDDIHFVNIMGIWTKEELEKYWWNYEADISIKNKVYSYELRIIHNHSILQGYVGNELQILFESNLKQIATQITKYINDFNHKNKQEKNQNEIINLNNSRFVMYTKNNLKNYELKTIINLFRT